MADRTDWGGPLRLMTLIDEHTRQCLAIKAARSLKSADVVEVLNEAIKKNGKPQCIRSDNGSEFIAYQVKEELQRQKIDIVYIDPGSPWQNGHIESFHNRLRDECLNQELFLSVTEARVVIERWRYKYNAKHPHSRCKTYHTKPTEILSLEVVAKMRSDQIREQTGNNYGLFKVFLEDFTPSFKNSTLLFNNCN